MPTSDNEQAPRQGRGVTLVVTNLSKVAGLVIGAHEAFGPARPPVMLFATAALVGAQAVEDFVLKLLSRTFGDS